MIKIRNLKYGSFAAGLLVLMVLSGCAWFSDKDTRPAHELARAGMEAYQDGDYSTAIETFERLKDWYPFSKYAILAELKIGDAYYKKDEYEDAVFAYEEFINLHPRNEAVPYVMYQIGRCYFDQVDTIDRDQANARKALESFNKLVERHPVDGYARKARPHIAACLKSLAGHELYVGRFYFKNRYYKAALSRFMAVLTKYPDVGVQHSALRYIALCEAEIVRAADENRHTDPLKDPVQLDPEPSDE
ncbi:MAG: outer membrane protein assembly factor BamD [Desulfobacterales bacterium]|nr:outer membrane protein assembly factor BamD [Desulfobacterales bacterium]